MVFPQGDSVALAFESIVKASHLNLTKNVIPAIGAQMAMQSSIFGRLGEFDFRRSFRDHSGLTKKCINRGNTTYMVLWRNFSPVLCKPISGGRRPKVHLSELRIGQKLPVS